MFRLEISEEQSLLPNEIHLSVDWNDYTLTCILQTLGVPPYKCDNESQVVTIKRRHKDKYSPWFETYVNNPEELS